MKLIEWRMARNMSQTALAKAIKVNQSSVAKYESGSDIPSPPVMLRIAELTEGEVTANDFYDLAPSAYRGRKRA